MRKAVGTVSYQRNGPAAKDDKVVVKSLDKIQRSIEMAAATVTSVLSDLSNLNTEVQQVRDFITANPSVPAAQVQQISDTVAVVKNNVDALKGQLFVP